MTPQILEGSWEEIARHAPELAGRRVRLTVLGQAEAKLSKKALGKAWAEYIGSVTSPQPHNLSGKVSETFGEIVEEKHRGRKKR